MTSWPLGISRICGLSEDEVSESLVMMIGGFGRFLEPGGLPRGRLATSMLEPSPPPAPPREVSCFKVMAFAGLKIMEGDFE